MLESEEFKRRWVQVSGKAGQVLETDRKVIEDHVQLAKQAHVERIIRASSTQLTADQLVDCLHAELGDTETSSEELHAWLTNYIDESSIPFLSTLYLAPSGVDRLLVWALTWEQQRAEDRGENMDSPQVPPKFSESDFLSPAYYRIRGRLNVPREVFISYPYCESDADGRRLLAWAGWDYLQRAHTLGGLYLKRRDDEGWTAERLTPMLAGLLELIPWIKQWHNEPSAEFDGQRMGDYYENFLNEECRRHHLTHDDLRAWRPPKKTRGKGKTAAKARADGRSNGEAAAKAASDDAAPAPSKRSRKRNKKGSAAEVAAGPEAD